MTTPTEKDAMALAVLDKARETAEAHAHRYMDGKVRVQNIIEARAHLASRIAELEAERDTLMWECRAAEEAIARAEAELAAVRVAAKAARRALARASESDPAYLAAYNDLDAAIDAARGGE